MKLAAHYNKASIIISVSVLLISAFIYYFTINHIAREQLDSNLAEEVAEVVDYINLNQRLPKPVDFDEDITTFTKTKQTKFDIRYFDAPYVNPKEKEIEKGRAVSALIKVKGDPYIVTIVESRENTEYLIQIISTITLILTAILLGILIITNRYILKGLWRPFYQILNHVTRFNLADASKMETVDAKVDEFRELSDAVSKMSSRVTADYQGLKVFTENASHEMMTPLAVIISKLDILIQDETLKAEQFSQISDIYSAANKLSRLNQALLLLVKIDNNLLQDSERLNLKSVIIEKVQQFQEMIQNKKINLDLDLFDLEINASKYLIDALVNNLFGNAIRHNRTDGIIQIIIAGKKLIFQNTSDLPPLNEEVIFERFYKGKTSEGTGLGLAILKNICNHYHFVLKYHYIKGMHSFEISF